MRLWTATDLHFNKSQFEFLLTSENEFDLLAINGDLLDDRYDFANQANWVNSLLSKFSKPVFVCSGNHDLDDMLDFEWITAKNVVTDNQKKFISSVRFGVAPYLGADFSHFYDCDVLLYHIPPKHTKTAIRVDNEGKAVVDEGCQDIYHALKNNVIRPKYLLCGHIHRTVSNQDRINNTIVINPNANPNNDKPIVFKIKL